MDCSHAVLVSVYCVWLSLTFEVNWESLWHGCWATGLRGCWTGHNTVSAAVNSAAAVRCGNPQLQSGRGSALLCALVSVNIHSRAALLLFCSFARYLLLAAQAKILAQAVFLHCPAASCAIIGTSVYGFAIIKLFPLIIHYSFPNNPSILINFL